MEQADIYSLNQSLEFDFQLNKFSVYNFTMGIDDLEMKINYKPSSLDSEAMPLLARLLNE